MCVFTLRAKRVVEQVAAQKETMWRRMEDLFVYFDNVIKRPSDYDNGTATTAVRAIVDAIVLAFRPEVKPSEKIGLMGKLNSTTRNILDKLLQNPFSGY